MKREISSVVIILVVLATTQVSARVFSFKNEWLASYFRVSGATSSLFKEGFRYSGGSDTVFTQDAGITYSGEFGFLFNMGESLTFRVGMEAIQAKTPIESYGHNPSGVKRFDIDHKILILNTVATIEYNYHTAGDFRLFISGGAGLAALSMDNAYTMTATGISELGTDSYTEKSEANVLSSHFSTGIEVLFVDAVTMMAEVGYRYLPVSGLTHKHATTVIGEGGSSKDVVKGSDVLNHDGSQRAFDMSGIYVGLSFRFYIPI